MEESIREERIRDKGLKRRVRQIERRIRYEIISH
jgi:hypothetical protein